MQQKEILLIKHVEKLGSEGDVVKVRPGYARNYLIPRKKALPLNYANKKRLDSLKLARVARETEELQDAQSMASKLGETSIAVAVKTGTGGKLFGSVTATQIVEKFQEKVSMDLKQNNIINPYLVELDDNGEISKLRERIRFEGLNIKDCKDV